MQRQAERDFLTEHSWKQRKSSSSAKRFLSGNFLTRYVNVDLFHQEKLQRISSRMTEIRHKEKRPDSFTYSSTLVLAQNRSVVNTFYAASKRLKNAMSLPRYPSKEKTYVILLLMNLKFNFSLS